MNVTEAFICDAVRTPIGRYGGALAAVRADDLAAVPIRALILRNAKVDWAAVSDVLYGCANQAGEDNRNVARMALLLAGLPQRRLIVAPGIVCGNPARSSAIRATLRLSSPAWLAQPKKTSSSEAQSSWGCFATSALIGAAARSSTRTLASEPP